MNGNGNLLLFLRTIESFDDAIIKKCPHDGKLETKGKQMATVLEQ